MHPPRSLVLLRLLIVMIAGMALPVAASESYSRTLLVFGDSLSAAYNMAEEDGWVSLLETRIESGDWPYRVINASVSGETSTGGLARLPAVLEAYEPDLVILELGGNDGLRGLPLTTLQQNLARMIQLIRAADAQVLLAGIQLPPNYGPRYTVPFFALFAEVAGAANVPLIPFLIDGIPQQPDLMQDDGIHPVAQAQPIILDNVWSALEPLLVAE